MGYYYEFYDPIDMEKIEEGKFIGMPFFYNELPIKIDIKTTGLPLDFIVLLSRKEAIELQNIMISNNTLFTDLMDKYRIECLIIKIT